MTKPEMTVERWIEERSGWPEGTRRIAESIRDEVTEESDLRDYASAYLAALDDLMHELAKQGFEWG